jgi:hypothetical protein
MPFPQASPQRGGQTNENSVVMHNPQTTYNPNVDIAGIQEQPQQSTMFISSNAPISSISSISSISQQQQQQQQQQHRLPSRDIPSNSIDYQQDQEIQPNYIPKPKITSDYIREYEAASEEKMKKHEQEKYREKVATDLFSQLQTPIFIAILFFLFQMPVINRLLRKYTPFIKIYNEDGNMNMTGLLVKSIIFGLSFLSTQSFANYLAII